MLTRTITLTILIALGGLFPAQAASKCMAENAVYTIDGEPGFRFKFVKLTEPSVYSDLALVLENPDSGLIFPFRIFASNGYSMNYLDFDQQMAGENKLGKELGEANIKAFFFMDKANEVNGRNHLKISDIPRSGEKAPDKMFFPELGVTIWYAEADFDKRISIATGMWHLSGCGQ